MVVKAQNPISNFLSAAGNLLIRLSGKRPLEPGDANLDLGRFVHLNVDRYASYDRLKEADLSRETSDEVNLLRNWMKRLVQVITQFDLDPNALLGKGGEYLHVRKAKQSTHSMLQQLYADFYQLATEFNTASKGIDIRRVRVSVSDFDSTATGRKSLGVIMPHFRISTSTRNLLVEGKPGNINFYMTPSVISLNLPETKAAERRKLSLRLMGLETGTVWTVYGLPTEKKDIQYLERALFRDLVLLSAMDAVANESGNTLEHVDNLARLNDENFRDSLSLQSEPSEDLVRDLVFAQQNAVHKLLNQQEETQAFIARDLHDSVLADILMLRRRISSGESAQDEDIVKVLDKLTESIRDIISGLVPRDLKDWGLETVLEDLLDKVAERSEADCSFEVEGTIPDLPSAVQLHIFRIVQECLNNIEKYARAKSILLELKSKDKLFTIKIADDGQGFDMSTQKRSGHGFTSGGFGLGGIEERVEIIKAFYPTRIKIESTTGKGTTVLLELKVAPVE